MGNSARILLFLISVLLLVSEILSGPSESTSTNPPKNLRSNKVPDSPLERVHVKQETGFDGKVRSIRFSLEPENVNKSDERQPKVRADTRSKLNVDEDEDHTSLSPSNFDSQSSSSDNLVTTRNTRVAPVYEVPKKLQESVSIAESSKAKRSIDKNLSNNDLQDLQTEEAKVFRPLFAYRQQVAKRFKLRNDRKVRRFSQKTYYGYYSYPYPPYYF